MCRINVIFQGYDWWDSLLHEVRADVEAALDGSEKGRSYFSRRNTKALSEMGCKINWTTRAWLTFEAALTEIMSQ
jgi:hypothetical protein